MSKHSGVELRGDGAQLSTCRMLTHATQGIEQLFEAEFSGSARQ